MEILQMTEEELLDISIKVSTAEDCRELSDIEKEDLKQKYRKALTKLFNGDNSFIIELKDGKEIRVTKE